MDSLFPKEERASWRNKPEPRVWTNYKDYEWKAADMERRDFYRALMRAFNEIDRLEAICELLRTMDSETLQ